MAMATVGAFARVEMESAEEVEKRLDAIPGVETFSLEERGKVGLIIEADDLDAAHALLTGPVRHAEGVMGVWPSYVYVDDEDSPVDDDGTPVEDVIVTEQGA
ncbi:MAG TPA: hypothetical protein ENJ06_03855 [Phycisphaeraceae bacterium]|nr:hypothetical protein [Phycisphaeraceae bacterium]